MKVYKIEVMVLDLDQVGEEGIKDVIENTRYPNRCISPEVKVIESRDIGEWHDDHPMNMNEKADAEYQRLFATERKSCSAATSELAEIINAARERGCAEHGAEIKWLFELPMTDAEAKRFNELTGWPSRKQPNVRMSDRP